jgi:hypothetical protein
MGLTINNYGTGLMGLRIFVVLSINIDLVRCVLSIFSLSKCCISHRGFNSFPKTCLAYYCVSLRHIDIFQFYGISP